MVSQSVIMGHDSFEGMRLAFHSGSAKYQSVNLRGGQVRAGKCSKDHGAAPQRAAPFILLDVMPRHRHRWGSSELWLQEIQVRHLPSPIQTALQGRFPSSACAVAYKPGMNISWRLVDSTGTQKTEGPGV